MNDGNPLKILSALERIAALDFQSGYSTEVFTQLYWNDIAIQCKVLASVALQYYRPGRKRHDDRRAKIRRGDGRTVLRITQ